MATTHALVKNRLQLVRDDLHEVIGRLSDDLLDWAPSEGMRTVRGQLQEIAVTELQLMGWVRDGKKLPYQEVEKNLPAPLDLAGVVELLATVRAKTVDYLDSLSDAELDQPIPMPEGWFEALLLPAVPRHDPFRSLAAHEWYHTGQLVSYLWSRGDDPYKW